MAPQTQHVELKILDAMTERCKSIYATLHQNVARVIYLDFIIKTNPYMVARRVKSQGDKLLAKTSQRYDENTLQIFYNRFVYIITSR